jgi:hypothetical protein
VKPVGVRIAQEGRKLMNRYPVLWTLSTLARVVGWVAFVLAAIMVIWGLAEVLTGASGGQARYGAPSDPFAVYTGIGLLSAGGSLFIFSIMLIIVGEVVKVIIDIEANTAETRRLLSNTSVVKAEVVGTAPENLASTTQASSPPSAMLTVEEVLELAARKGYTAQRRGYTRIFTKDGKNTTINTPAEMGAWKLQLEEMPDIHR